MTIDEVDLSIIQELQKNGRSSNREVARVLGLSEGTIRQRLKKLEATKVMKLSVITDTGALGEMAIAHVRIKAKPRLARSIMSKIAEYPACNVVGLTVGAFDVFAVVSAKTREKLAVFIDAEISAIKGVVQVDVREPVAIAKHSVDFIHIP
jgi:Lrp/AsnC family transcriptional regulator for asnA, asnC and gidA